MIKRPPRGRTALAALACICFVTLSLRAESPADDLIADQPVVQAVKKVMPSVVNIATKSVVRVRDSFDPWFQDFFGSYYGTRTRSTYSLGSGVVIDESGYLLTNDHVVRRADQIQVQFAAGTNIYEAKVVARDPRTDVALLKLAAPTGTRFHAIKMAREDDLQLGETVLALGNPFGLGGTVTRGILSSKSRTLAKEGEQLDVPNWLQTDAAINPGNSGGPLVNLRGELIGINVAVLNQYQGQPVQGIGFAIPIRLVERALSDLFHTEFVKSYWFGARVKVGTQPLTISNVQPKSPAARAGLEPGDAVLQVGGKSPKSFIDFANLLAAGDDETRTLTIEHGGNRSQVSVRLVPQSSVFNDKMVQDKLGLTLDPLSADVLADRYNLNSAGGFLITGVQKDSPAAAGHLQSGILITGVDGEQPPATNTDLAKLIYARGTGEPVTFEIAMWQRMGNLNVLRQGEVRLVPR